MAPRDETDQTTAPTDLTRRRLLQLTGAAAGTAAVGSLLPPSLHRAMAQPVRTGAGPEVVEHVIVLMQENRSFDHYLGTLRGVRGFGDTDPLRRRTGDADVFAQPRAVGGDVLPFSLRRAAKEAGRDASDIQYLGDLPHGFLDATDAWAGGWWDGWVPAKTTATMTYYDRRDIPLQHELAETFTVCDGYHCSVFGSTNPNRNYLWSGTVGHEPVTGERAVTNAAYSYDHAGYDWTTYPERLERAGVSWQIFQEWDNFTDNAVEYFARFKAIGSKVLASVDGDFRTTEELYDSLHDRPAAEQDALLAQVEQGRQRLTRSERSLFDRAVARSRPGTLRQRLRDAIADGTLPRVTWVVPPAADSEHPGASTPLGSANLVYDLLDAIASEPGLWERTALLINFDENDGYFDHVPPPVQPRPLSGVDTDWYAGRPIGLGPRVPMTIVSPWTVGGYVASEVFDHTSVLQFLEHVTGVKEPNISRWRRQVTGDLTSAFDFAAAGRPPSATAPDPVPAAIERWHPEPPAVGSMPRQEQGRRPSRALPYRPVVSGRVVGGRFVVRVRNPGGREAAPMAVYPFHAGVTNPSPVHVVVPADGVATAEVGAPGAWDLLVQGPARYWASLRGSRSGSAGRLDGWVEPGPRGITAVLVNDGDEALRVVVRERRRDVRHAFTLRAGAQTRVQLTTDHGWFDVEMSVPADTSWGRRTTGCGWASKPLTS